MTADRQGVQVLSPAGIVPPAALRRTAQIINTIIPANSTLPINQAGEAFYIIAASATVQIRPSGGTFNAYYTGTGIRADPQNNFSMVEVKNANPFSVTLSIWIGFGSYLDNRLIPISSVFFEIAFPTNPVASATTNINITDRSGTAIVDVNGVTWLALNRISILITNFDTVNPMALQDSALAVGSIFACLPNTSAVVEVSGNYRINLGATPLNCLVSEIYNCITPTLGP